jgi:excisionase family DNA binding protein
MRAAFVTLIIPCIFFSMRATDTTFIVPPSSIRPELFGPEHDDRTQYVRRREAARFLGLAEGTLANMAHQRRGPTFHRIGRTVLYSRAELHAYVSAGRVEMAGAA